MRPEIFMSDLFRHDGCIGDTISKMATQSKASTATGRTVHFTNRGASLGLRSMTTPQLIEQLEAGFSIKALHSFESNSGLDLTFLASLIGIPEKTLVRRKSSGCLSSDESERLLRISNIFEKAVELFEGDADAAIDWLTTPKKVFNGQPPLQYSRTEPGAREVENLIGRVDHGVFA
jgi:putative toxin-antitoxin system antitoxin component (TIGR02293 family)